MNSHARPAVALGDLVEILSGSAFKSERFADAGDLPLIRIRDVKRGWSDTYYSGDFESRYVINDGDLLVGMDGEFNRERWRGGRALLNQRVCKLTANAKKLNGDYLYYFLPKALKEIEDRTPFATVKHLSSKDIRGIKIPLPPLDEQQRIATILDKADALRRKRKHALELLDGLAQSIFLQMFGDPVSNERSITSTTLGEISAEMRYGPRFYNEVYSSNGIRIARITDLDHNGNLDFDTMPRLEISGEELEYHRSRPGEILFARTGATVGKMALVAPEDPITIPGAYFIRLRFPDEIDPTFAWQSLKCASIQKIIEEQSRQSAQQNFSGPGLRRLPILLPEKTEQTRFANAIRSLMLRKRVTREYDSKTTQLFSSLQHRAFSGQF